ncbi:MAG: winged helix-turn-helix transcriptional regulator [Trueperaceae bacterium]|nr:winged helix-turn-helix transcriptional regulator [Trueperaceae bacterium]
MEEKVEKFLKSFWGVRQHLFRHVTPLMEQAHGLELSEYFLLKHISEHNDTPSAIAELLQIPPHGISRKLDSLQRQGLITRTLDPQDARKRVLEMTEKGKATLHDAQKLMNEEVSQMLMVLNTAELEQLLSSLEKLA